MNKSVPLKIKIFYILFILPYYFLSAQTTVQVTGKLVDNVSKDALEFATISFMSKDSTVAPQGGVTDLNGNYSIAVIPGTYQVRWEYITFKSIVKDNVTIGGDKNFGTIEMEVDTAKLDAVVVVAEKTTVDIRLDKKIYNIGKDLTVRGGTASDVLDNVPSVSVDVEGNVALRGNDNVTILIDGRPSALVGFNGAEALRQIPADAIEKVEVITSPSARYDAEGTAGILNIILRKKELQGFNGSLQLDTGYNPQLGLALNANYRTGKWNLFTNTGTRYRERPGNAASEAQFFSPNARNRFVNENREFDRVGRNLFSSLGAEYFINDNSSIVANVVLRLGNDDDLNSNSIVRLDENGALNEQTFRTEAESENEVSAQYSLDYQSNLDKNGQKLQATLQYSTDDELQRANIIETDVVAGMINDREFTDQNEFERSALAQLDWELPVGEDTQWEAGYRGNYRDIRNRFFLAENNGATTATLFPDRDLNNTFDYQELVNAVYGQYGREIGKFSLLAGLRFEQTNVEIRQATINTTDTKDYGNLFPTLNLGYELRDGENITLGFNRRVRRPRGRFLNPFPSRSSESNIFQGNVDLDPTFTNSLDLGYLKRWKKFTLSTSIYYNRSDDNWNFVQVDTGEITDNGDPIIRRSPINLSTQERLGYELTLTYRPYKWWTINADGNLFRVVNDGDFIDPALGINQNFDFENVTYFVRLNQKFSLPAGIDVQTRMNYRGPSENAQTVNEGILSMNLAASKDLLDERATISMNVSDLFNSRKRRSVTTGLDSSNIVSFINDSEFQWRERQINLSFVYRFNQKKRNARNGGGGDGDFDNFEG
ncbi:MAG: outer membrane beta-barrel family protein [Nonlabens sp.]